jgi:hypothetical protein
MIGARESMKFVTILLLCALPAVAACKGTGADSAAVAAAQRCTCGTPEADFEGCTHPACVKGERNPENPDCVCGTMKIGEKK